MYTQNVNIIKTDKKNITVHTCYSKNKVCYWNYSDLMEVLLDYSEEALIEHIPKAYIKNICINKESEKTKEKFVDEIALKFIVCNTKNFKLYKILRNFLVGNHERFKEHNLVESLNSTYGYSRLLKSKETAVKVADDLQQDLLHKLENGLDNRILHTTIGKDLQTLRVSRRKVKMEKEFCKVLNDFMNKHNLTMTSINSLEKEINTLAKVKLNKPYNERANQAIHEEWKNKLRSFKIS